MIVVPLEPSQKIAQEDVGENKLGRILGTLMFLHYVMVMNAALVLVTAINEGVTPALVVPLFYVVVMPCAVLWLMHQRREAFIWMFAIQTFVDFMILSHGAPDYAIVGYAFAAFGLVAYVIRSRRCQETFNRTMEGPTK